MNFRQPVEISSRPLFWTPRLLPIVVSLICASWIFTLPAYTTLELPWIPHLMCISAFFLLLLRVLNRNREPLTEKLILSRLGIVLAVVSCVLILWVIPLPYSVGTIPLGLGWIFLPYLRRHLFIGHIAASLVQTGFLLLFCSATLPFVFAWTARTHELTGIGVIFTFISRWLLCLFGLLVEQINSSLFLFTYEEPHLQTMITEKFIPLPFVLFFLLWVGVILVKSKFRRIENLTFFIIAFFGYLIFRFTILLLILAERLDPSYFWDPWAITLSMIPLVLIIKEPKDSRVSPSPPSAARLKKRPKFRSFLLGFLLGLSGIVAFAYRDPGQPKSGRLLINEYGSNWEWTTEPMDTVTFNERTTYNYYCFSEFLKHYYDVKVNFDSLTPEVLNSTDVLILKIPTQPYLPEEIEAIVEFVRRGGGVWVIGDHTNVFGSSSYFNPLLEKFHCHLNFDSVNDLKTGKLSLFTPPPIFAHPTVLNLPPYLFATSCSIVAPWNTESAIIGCGLRSDHLDYSQDNFFPDRSRKHLNPRFGLFLQQAGIHCGKGRLLIYTDSTTFSNFFVFLRGKPELILGSVEWLNRTDHYQRIKSWTLFLGIGLLLLCLLLNMWNGAFLTGLLLSIALSSAFVERNTRAHYPPPNPRRSVPWIHFEREHSQYFLPTLRLAENQDNSYLTFYVWTQRLGAMPKETTDLEEALKSTDPIIFIDPKIPFTNEERGAIKEFLLRGGMILLLDSADNNFSSAADILNEYGLTTRRVQLPEQATRTLTFSGRSFPLTIGGKFLALHGGEPFLRSDQGEVIGSSVRIGEGRLWTLSCGHLFRNQCMGHTTVIPDEGMRGLYRLEFGLIGELFGQFPDQPLK